MRQLLKFKQSTGEYKICGYDKVWRTKTGKHYACYPFFIYKNEYDKCILTHMSSGAQICQTRNLVGAKYIATRLLPVAQFLLPDKNLVDRMSVSTKQYCMDVIHRYRDCTAKEIENLDIYCPYSI